MSALLALAQRDVRLALRQGGGAGTAIGFLLCVIVLLPIGIGPDQAVLRRIAPGALWIALLLAVLLSADRIFQADYDDGSLDIMAMSPVPLELAVLAKAAAHWLTTSLPLALIAPWLGVLINIDAAALGALALAMAVGSAALSLIGAIGAAVTVGLRRGGLILSMLVLPLYIPVLIFGMAASSPNAVSGLPAAALLILIALALASLVLAPIAAAAALRAYIRS